MKSGIVMEKIMNTMHKSSKNTRSYLYADNHIVRMYGKW